jgi:hypothetical protein
MNLDSSRRIFLRIIPGAFVGLLAVRALALQPVAGQAGNGATSPLPKPGGGSGGGLPKPPSGSGTTDGTLPPAPDSTNPTPPTQNGRHGSNTGAPEAPKPNPKLLKANQTGIKTNVEKLAELAEELKKQVEDTDSTKVLSLDMIKKSQEIEKLAHTIATLAKG